MGILENTINEISEKNSTTTQLEGGATFIGDVENILAFSSLEVNIYSNSGSSNQGIVLTCGQDKELTSGIFTEVDTYTAGENYHRVFPLKGKFMRLEYTNGGTTQTEFKLQAIKSNLPPDDNDRSLFNLLNTMNGNLDNIENNTANIHVDTSNITLIVDNIEVDTTDIISNLQIINNTLDTLNNDINSNLTVINTNLDTLNTDINSNLIVIDTSINNLDINNTGINSNLLIINSTLSNIELNNSNMNSNLTTINSGINSNLEIINNTLTSGIKTYFIEGLTDSFNRLRVGQPETIFENNNIFNKKGQYMDELVQGSALATYQLSNSAVVSSTTANGDRVIRQSHQYLNYQPGKSLLMLATGVLNYGGANQSNVSTNIGYFNDNNGIFFKYNNGILSVNIRSNTSGSVVDTTVPQSQWNLDTMDGTGPSGITLDPTKSQIFLIDIEWLGVGAVRTGFVIDGNFRYVHKFRNANVRDNVYMATPNLPVRYEIAASGTGNTQGKMMEICATVMSEGGFEPVGVSFSATRVIPQSITTGNEFALVAIRLKSGFNRAYVRLNNISTAISDNKTSSAVYRLRIFRNVNALTDLFASGYTFTSSGPDSVMEYTINPVYISTSSSVIESVGKHTKILEGFASTSANNLNNHQRALFLSSNITGTRDICVLSVLGLSNVQAYGNITWIEHL